MLLKLCLKLQRMELYKVCINHDPGMTLTYFMARSAEVACPRSQVSVYRTIGPLVYFVWSKVHIIQVLTTISLWSVQVTPGDVIICNKHKTRSFSLYLESSKGMWSSA